MYTGLRVGEFLGLKWEDIDYEKKTIRVKNNVVLIKSRNKSSEDDNNYVTKVSTVKTKTSYRFVPLANKAIEMLKILDSERPEHKANDHVAMNGAGNLMSSRNLT